MKHTKPTTRRKMFFQACLLSVLALAAANPLGGQPAMQPIIDGVEVSIEEVPYQVLLQLPKNKICGGVILASQWILTASRCLNSAPNEITVRAGTASKSSGGSVHKVANYTRHENYTIDDNNIPIHDIGLLMLTTELALDDTRKPIELYKASEEIVAGERATVVGWGSVNAETEMQSENLQKVDLNIVSKSDCSKAYSVLGGLPVGQICAGTATGGKGQCRGDEGGPLIINHRLAGIISWHRGCGVKEYPEVNTEVSCYTDWIRQITKLQI